MQQWEDFKERVAEQAKALWARLQELPLYLDTKERFDSLPARTQRWVLGGAGALILLIVLSFPLSFLWTSSENMDFFEEARTVTQELLTVEREAKTVSSLPRPPAPAVLKSSVQSLLQRAQLSPEQILPLEDLGSVQPASALPQGVRAQGLKVRLAKLNLRQITDIGGQLETQLQRGVNIWSFAMQKNEEMPEYFDVEYDLVTFDVASGDGN